ncbi:hypothetical protein [Psychrobacter sp. P2G3]|uniref:hypothetical protein n=1 Tax=Psychrobacter sp. P2G3 TaxID=1699622 RepID=UPI000AF89ED1|nr:hypothetical protein [Psychrobacter sp. P2G3]
MTYSLDFRKQVLKSLDEGMTMYSLVAAVQPRPKPYRKEMGSSEVSTPRLDAK